MNPKAPDPQERERDEEVPLPPVSVASALLLSLYDEDPDVRGEAAWTLLGALGLKERAAVPCSRVAALLAMLQSPLASVSARAAADLLSLREALLSGRTPEDLGMAGGEADGPSPALLRLTETAADPRGGDLDVALLRQLVPEERPWAEHLLYYLLGRRDPRGVRAALVLGARWAAPALRELAEEDGPAAEAAQKALAWLGG